MHVVYIEVKHAVLTCDPDRAAGYDGFNLRFIKEMWNTIGVDITHFVRQFFIWGEFPHSINTTWVSLIPKNKNPTRLIDYRPISVIGSLYKAISKILADM